MYKNVGRFAHRLRCRGESRSSGKRIATSYDHIRTGPGHGRVKIAKRPRRGRVYVVRFILRGDDRYTFIKVGVSGARIDERFAADHDHYRLQTLSEGIWRTWSDSEAFETSIHNSLRPHALRPRVPLASGNTECYADAAEVLKTLRHIGGA